MEEIRLSTYSQAVQNKWLATVVINGIRLDGKSLSINFSIAPLRILQPEQFGIIDILSIKVTVMVNATPNRRIGDLRLSPLSLGTRESNSWKLQLDAGDIWTVERDRGNGDVYINLAVDVLLNASLYGIDKQGKPLIISIPLQLSGEEAMRIPKSDWIVFMEQSKLITPYVHDLPQYIVANSAWLQATKNLTQARTLLRNGHTHGALEACLSEMESHIDETERGGPYKEATWKGILNNLPDQKQEALKTLFAGVSTYLNKVGHHRDKQARDERGIRPPIHVDQAEADLMVAITQLTVTYIEIIREQGAS